MGLDWSCTSLEDSGEGSVVWQELGVALCLVLIIEGILPFLYPRRWKEWVAVAAEVDERTMRIVGFCSMILGLVLLQIVRS